MDSINRPSFYIKTNKNDKSFINKIKNKKTLSLIYIYIYIYINKEPK